MFADDVEMDEEQKQSVDESMKLAEQLQQEEFEQTENQEEAQGESISSLVNQEYVNQLLEMGFSKAVCEKALFLTKQQNQENVDKALDWIQANMDAPDFEEELKIVG